jgi:hypothetical protein
MGRYLSISLSVSVLLWATAGCKGKQADVDASEGGDVRATASLPPVAVDTSSVGASQRIDTAPPAPVLAHGTHMVFGIRMPRGMIPVEAGESVRRFEGTHPIEAVKGYIVSQLAGQVNVRPNRFGEGYFISEAVPASSQKDLHHVDGSAKRFHIKIFDGSLGGASVDIWEAKKGEQLAEESTTHAGTTLRNLVGTRNPKPSSIGPAPRPTSKNRRQRERATFRVFEKMASEKPLTDADYQSSFFTDQ